MTVATPPVVVLMMDVPPPSRVPAVVVNSTAVPFGTGCPLSVTVAVTVTLESTRGFALDTATVTLTPVGGGFVPGGELPPVGGAVGVSPLHAANSRRTAMKTIHVFRSLNLVMSEPPSGARHAHAR
jgi:hypothetical protein